MELTLQVEDAVLWNGIENPYLYTAEVIVSIEGKVCDTDRQDFGIRTYHIDSERGFFLNGKYLDLHGVNYHQDSFENGWAMTDGQRERDYKMICEMGCTSVRMAHYQHDRYEYALCDRLGLTVWTEIGIVNKMSADETDRLAVAEGFAENAGQQLTELIRQNYNHPCVIVWGISNELYQMTEEIYSIYTALNKLAKKNYQSEMHEKIWAQFAERPYLWGKYIWCMFDFASDGRNEGDTKGQNDKGLATRERMPKDAYYFYKSIWNAVPMVHLTEKGFRMRDSVIWRVKAYSNADSAELFVNGVSQGKINHSGMDTPYASVFVWENVAMMKGEENEILVRAFCADGTTLADRAFWRGC